MNKNGMIGIITAFSIVMVGATVMVSYGVVLQAEAASPHTWCFDVSGRTVCTLGGRDDCNKIRKNLLEDDPTKCYKQEPS